MRIRVLLSWVLLLTVASPALGQAPRVFLADARALMQTKLAVQQGDPFYTPALEELQRRADRALRTKPFSVTRKKGVPPSGNKHDYMSIAPYWWPNPNTSNGLPYVRRDGQRNPQVNDDTFDRVALGHMTGAVHDLAWAYFFTENEAYAEHAALLLRTWFLDEATAMNPHLQYAQAIPGVTDGRGIGIIETIDWIELVDAVGLIQPSRHWTANDHRALQRWFEMYIEWLKTSAHGREEEAHPNNHGTWFDAQIITFSLFAGHPRLARQQLSEWTTRRLSSHIDANGRQPHEIARTLSWDYSLYNLRAFVCIAQLSRHVGADLWNYRTADGRSIRIALDYLLPYLEQPDRWPHEQISDMDLPRIGHMILPLAYERYRDPRYLQAYRALPDNVLARHVDRLKYHHAMHPQRTAPPRRSR